MDDDDLDFSFQKEIDTARAFFRGFVRIMMGLISLTFLLVVIGTALRCDKTEGAPVPLPRPPAPMRLTGDWLMTWGSGQYKLTFLADGRYSCVSDREVSQSWAGNWHLNNNMLCVVEHHLQDGVPTSIVPLRWQLSLKREKAGALYGITSKESAYPNVYIRLCRP
jgi:hypothetical protein